MRELGECEYGRGELLEGYDGGEFGGGREKVKEVLGKWWIERGWGEEWGGV